MGHLGSFIYFLCIFLFAVGMSIASGLKSPKYYFGFAFAVLAYIALCCAVTILKEFTEFMQWHVFK